MNVDLKFVELMADVLEMFFKICIYSYTYVFVFLTEQYDPSHYEKTHPHIILQVPTTQLAKMSMTRNSSNSQLTSLKYFHKTLQSHFLFHDS